MRIEAATLPEGAGTGQDRWRATSVHRDAPPADEYVHALSEELAARLDSSAGLRTVLRDAIQAAARRVDAVPGAGPSSTVLLARQRADALQVLVLGDSTAVIGHRDGSIEPLTDDRLATIAPGLRAHYRDRLRDGHGYDDTHRAQLVAVQAHEVHARNAPGGYWIAEADPHAATQAQCYSYPLADVRWLVLATDGAQRPVDHLGIPWDDIARSSSAELAELLTTLHQWETDQDPDGVPPAQVEAARRQDHRRLAQRTRPLDDPQVERMFRLSLLVQGACDAAPRAAPVLAQALAGHAAWRPVPAARAITRNGTRHRRRRLAPRPGYGPRMQLWCSVCLPRGEANEAVTVMSGNALCMRHIQPYLGGVDWDEDEVIDRISRTLRKPRFDQLYQEMPPR